MGKGGVARLNKFDPKAPWGVIIYNSPLVFCRAIFNTLLDNIRHWVALEPRAVAAMSFSDEANSDIPVLPATHSGIPPYLLDKAKDAKEAIFNTRTKPVQPRQRLPVIPQGIERGSFLNALDELRGQLGAEHVEVNDKPLKDGW